MTDQHPLTSKICEEIAPWPVRHPAAYDCMRAAADWELERAINWWKIAFNTGSLPSYLVDSIIENFKNAMRPTITQESN